MKRWMVGGLKWLCIQNHIRITGVAAIIAWGLLVLAIGQGQEEALNAELQNLIHRIQEDTDASRPPPREPDERP